MTFKPYRFLLYYGCQYDREALFHFIDRLIPEYTKDGVTAFPVGLEVRGEFKPSDLDVYAALREGRNICADYNVDNEKNISIFIDFNNGI